MQISDQILARRYAKALFQLGLEHREESRLQQDLSEAVKLLRDSMSKICRPMAGASKQKALLRELVGSQISKRALRFLELLADKKRFYLLPFVARDYGAMMDEHGNIVRAQVKTAAPLSKSESARLEEGLKKFFKREAVLDIRESPELLGGMVVRFGDWVLDGSLQGKMRRLAAQLGEES